MNKDNVKAGEEKGGELGIEEEVTQYFVLQQNGVISRFGSHRKQ